MLCFLIYGFHRKFIVPEFLRDDYRSGRTLRSRRKAACPAAEAEASSETVFETGCSEENIFQFRKRRWADDVHVQVL